MTGALTLPPQIAEMADAGALFAISHSGGKDSQAMTIRLRAVLPHDQLVIVHAPTLLKNSGRVEWPGTLAHIRATTTDLPLILARANEDLLAMVRSRGMFPTPAIRNCTSDKERSPIERELRRYLKAHPRYEGRIVSCMGLRADESRNRARRVPVSVSAWNSKADRHWIDWLPIHDMTEPEVFDTIAAAGERPHWVYAKGMIRCSCSFCIMATLRDLALAARLRPRLAAEYIALEEEIGHTLSPTRMPLRDLLK